MFHFNPRSPYGERLSALLLGFLLRYFNPRSPYGERLFLVGMCMIPFAISIHAPLTGSDCREQVALAAHVHFNPRSPYGERRCHHSSRRHDFLFQSTLPLRGATKTTVTSQFTALFQSTLPLRGATLCFDRIIFDKNNFNPRSPYGERLDITWDDSETDKFQSTLPLRGATVMLF